MLLRVLIILALPLPHFILNEFESVATGSTGLDGYASEIAARADELPLPHE